MNDPWNARNDRQALEWVANGMGFQLQPNHPFSAPVAFVYSYEDMWHGRLASEPPFERANTMSFDTCEEAKATLQALYLLTKEK